MALFLPPAIQRSVMPRYTTQMGRAQAVPAFTSIHACVCQATQFPASTWLRAASTAAAETSRPRCPLGGGTPTMQLLSHLCVAASHWPTAIHCRHQATRHWPLTRFHGHTLPFFHEVRVEHWLQGPTSHCFVLCASVRAAQQAAVVHAAPPPTRSLRAATADEAEPSPCSRDCCVRC